MKAPDGQVAAYVRPPQQRLDPVAPSPVLRSTPACRVSLGPGSCSRVVAESHRARPACPCAGEALLMTLAGLNVTPPNYNGVIST
jgi:hypothetical protein